jgi:hypothetical protein
MRKKVNLSRKYKERDFLNNIFGSNKDKSKVNVASEINVAPEVKITAEDYNKILSKANRETIDACTNKLYSELPLIFFNHYGIVRYYRNKNIEGYTLLDKTRSGCSILAQIVQQEINKETKLYSEYISQSLLKLFLGISELIENNKLDLKKSYSSKELYQVIASSKSRDKGYNYLKSIKDYLKSANISELNEYLKMFEVDSSLDESYLYSLFEDENEVPVAPKEAPPVSDKLSDEDIEILDDQLNEPSPETQEGVSSASMDMMGVLKNISKWRLDFEKSDVLSSFVAGAEIVESDTERESFQYLTDEQYGTFVKLIDSARDIASYINDLSYDAEKLLSDIELSRKMMVSTDTER